MMPLPKRPKSRRVWRLARPVMRRTEDTDPPELDTVDDFDTDSDFHNCLVGLGVDVMAVGKDYRACSSTKTTGFREKQMHGSTAAAVVACLPGGQLDLHL